MYGYRTPAAGKADRHARYVYIDTYNSIYGDGWRRDAAKVTHKGNGAFCFSFVLQALPQGYPLADVPRNGERHRVTVMGPGVTPIVQWEGSGLQRYDVVADADFDLLFDRLVGPATTFAAPSGRSPADLVPGLRRQLCLRMSDVARYRHGKRNRLRIEGTGRR